MWINLNGNGMLASTRLIDRTANLGQLPLELVRAIYDYLLKMVFIGRVSKFAVSWCMFVIATLLGTEVVYAQPAQDTVPQRAAQIRQNASVIGAAAQNANAIAANQTDDQGSGIGGLDRLADQISGGPDAWLSPRGLSSSLQILLLLTVLSLAPAILLMTTCYVRVIVVFGLLKQALGVQQLPPSQVITAISLFVTLFVMSPVWTEVYEKSIEPYTQPGSQMTASEAWDNGVAPIRYFMANQIDMAGNHDDIHMFFSRYAPDQTPPSDFDEVPLQVLLPAYMLSELKVAFLMGFKIYLPFLILDIVIAAVTVSMGMMMLPPALISTPFKLLLFVLVDGWTLVVAMLIDSFGTIPG